jgi:hypothetical protein
MLVISSPSSGKKPPTYLAAIRPLVWQDADDDKPIPHCTTFCINGSYHVWVTAAHCFDEKNREHVTIDKRPAKILKMDIDKDMAILYAQVPSGDLQISPFEPSWGDEIKAIGYVSGEEFPMVFYGRVSNPKATPVQFGKPVIVMDMSIGGGASGGPVLNSMDQVIGMSEISFGAGPFSQISPMSGAVTFETFRAFTEGYWR